MENERKNVNTKGAQRLYILYIISSGKSMVGDKMYQNTKHIYGSSPGCNLTKLN